MFSEAYREIKENVCETASYFLKWALFALLAGAVGGFAGALFVTLIAGVTGLREAFPWLLLLMPLSGLLIILLHEFFGETDNSGTNQIIDSVSKGKAIDRPIPFLIFVSTVLSHLVGASSGREGAALQIGGGIGDMLGASLRFDEQDRKIAVMAGMSAVFGAVFGTPIAAAVFPIEVVSVGIMHFSALAPCLLAAFTGYYVSLFFGVHFESFLLISIPEFSIGSVVLLILLGILCGITAQIFCALLHAANRLYAAYTPNPYRRILTASALFILLTLLCGTDLYEGTSMRIIEGAFYGSVPYEAFLLKMLFTAIALGGRFRGGEIVPTFCVGASLGYTFGMLLGFSPALCAACGMAGLFVGVTNCPITTLLISLEMLTMEAMPFYGLVIAVAYCFSGYASLYESQRIMYSKTKTKYIFHDAES